MYGIRRAAALAKCALPFGIAIVVAALSAGAATMDFTVATGDAQAATMGAGTALDSHVLVWWRDAATPRPSDWVIVHDFDGSALGLLPAGSASLANPTAQTIDTADERAGYFLVPTALLGMLASGQLPPAWEAAFSQEARALVNPAQLRDVRALAGDQKQSLIRLPDVLRPIADAPGGRCQRLALAPALSQAPQAPPIARPDRDELWGALASAVSADRMFADLDYLATTLQTRYSYTDEMNLACDYAKAQFEALGLTTYFDTFSFSGHDVKNVVAVKPGIVDPTVVYVIGGHLDSTSPDPWNVAPGAEDNGTGAASVIEAARLLAPFDCANTIYFICFTAEEQGLRGSEHFAAWAEQQGLDIQGVLIYDMIGYYDPDDEDLWLEGFHTGVPSTWLMALVQSNTNRYTPLSVYQYGGDGWGSDHVPFHEHGYSAILSIENEWDSYPCYHRICDTVDWLDASLWSGISAANVITLAQLAGLQGEPGAIAGTVTMPGGRPIIGAHLRLEATGYLPKSSGIVGEFAWDQVFPGTYLLTVEADGFEPDSIVVTVASAAAIEIDIALERIAGSAVAEAGPLLGGAALRILPSLTAANAIVRLELPATESGSLSVYAPDGRLVRRVYSAGALAAGQHTFEWNGRDCSGRELAPGIYWVRWQGAHSRAKQSLVLLR